MRPTRRTALTLALTFVALPAMADQGWRWTDGGKFELTGLITGAKLGGAQGLLTVEANGTVWTAEVGQPWRSKRAGLSSDMLRPGQEVVLRGERSTDPAQRVMKAEVVVIGGTEHVLYPG